MRFYKLSWLLLTFVLIGCSHTADARSQSKAMSKPQDDLFLKAMVDELKRSVQKLKLKNLEKPYFIEYYLLDRDLLVIEASFGAIINVRQENQRPIRTDVRVGSYQKDNTGFVGQSTFRGLFRAMMQHLLAPDSYRALRHDLWLMTDQAYKDALEQYAGKQAYLKDKMTDAQKLPDFTKHKPVIELGPRHNQASDRATWRKRVRDLSALFRSYPAIQNSGIKLEADLGTRYLVNSEGSRLRHTTSTIALYAWASTQAQDGTPLKSYRAFYAGSSATFPSQPELREAIGAMADELSALRIAPKLDNYTGPVLFADQAVGRLIETILAPELLAHRQPMIGIPQLARMSSQLKENRINRRMLPKFFNVVDDPTISTLAKQALQGGYRYDAQGVIGQKVNVITKGVVKALLSSRTPIKDAPTSTGHAQRGVFGFNESKISNLIVQTNQGQSHKKLKAKLIALCKDQGLSYGLLIKRLDDSTITGHDLSFTEMMQQSMGGLKPTVPTPLVVVKIGLDGSEQLVRGVTIDQFGTRALRDIVMAGDQPYVYHRFASDLLDKIPMPIFAFGGLKGAKSLSSVASPALLFDELELRSKSGAKKPMQLSHPFFKKRKSDN